MSSYYKVGPGARQDRANPNVDFGTRIETSFYPVLTGREAKAFLAKEPGTPAKRREAGTGHGTLPPSCSQQEATRPCPLDLRDKAAPQG